MPNTYRVQHCFQGNGGTSLDMYCNQFYFFAAAHVPADVETWGPLLAGYVHQLFVNPAGGQPISRYMSKHAYGNGGKTSIYDVTASGGVIPTGPPIFVISDDALTGGTEYLTDSTGAGDTAEVLPEEVAVCLSYQAIHSDGNLPRRRGRIYLGPLNQLAIENTDGTFGRARVKGSFISTILGNAVEIQAAAAANDFEWRVFSQMDGFAFKIVTFSVDDAFDTIRGRGGVAGYRETLAIT